MENRARDNWAGEVAVAHLFGIEGYDPPERTKAPPFQFKWQGFSFKIVTKRNPQHLMVPEGRVKAMAYLLCGIYGEPKPEHVTIYGWARSVDVLAAPIEVIGRGDRDVPSHVIARDQLLPLTELAQIFAIPLERLSHRFRYPDMYTESGYVKDEIREEQEAQAVTLF